MEQNKQKIFRMQQNYSSKQLKKHGNSYGMASKKVKNEHINKSKNKKSITNIGTRSSSRLTKDNIKYLYNKTTAGTPFDKSIMLSHLSTPNEKPYNLNMSINNLATNHFQNLYNLDVQHNSNKTIQTKIKTQKRRKNVIKKEAYQRNSHKQNNTNQKWIEKVIFTSKQNNNNNYNQQKSFKVDGNSIIINFIVPSFTSLKNYGNLSSSVSLTSQGWKNQNSIQNKKFSFTYSIDYPIAKIKENFIRQHIPEKLKQNYYGVFKFECFPYNNIINTELTSDQGSLKNIIDKGYNEFTLNLILLRNKINYEHLQFRDFEILDYLGTGGFSSVYLARCTADGQLCALKFIKKESINTQKKLGMLQNEKNILFTISHDNLIDLYYAFETRSFIVFGLQYCPNGNLYSLLQKNKNFSQNDTKCIIKQILNGLEYLHENNIIFRDVKLENILFDSKGNIKITDFGLSKPDVISDQITFTYCGSPQYMAPQMLAKSGHSFGVDYYSLGILLYELLYGRSPFYAPNKQDIFVAILNQQPTFPKNSQISKQAKALIKGLLTKNPKHRIGSLKGIKQIASHPWMRKYQLNQNQVYETFKRISSNNKDKIHETPQQAHNMKKMHEIFEKEKKQPKSQKYFFQQSFINKNILQQIERNVYKFSGAKVQRIKFTKNKMSFYDNNHNSQKKLRKSPLYSRSSSQKTKKYPY